MVEEMMGEDEMNVDECDVDGEIDGEAKGRLDFLVFIFIFRKGI
jgi:hypothetical protein